MKIENKVTIIVVAVAIFIFVVGTILDRMYFHHNTELGLTLIQNFVEIILFVAGFHLGMKIREELGLK